MNDDFIIRNAVAGDAAAITAIYNHYVATSTATWQYEPSEVDERLHKITDTADRYPVIVAEREGQFVGYAYISPFRGREGWVPTVENSVYVHPDHLGHGYGRAMLEAIIQRSREAGYRVMVACISGDQEASISLHESFGFIEAGRIHEAGGKFGQILDAVFLELRL
ncbi:MAG TPA: GNAT family N-acetyltransferase [Capsulimonadaceae bacterium]|jgi:phosphinothricin acetyltransferase